MKSSKGVVYKRQQYILSRLKEKRTVRVEELARIIGGENITEISLQNAREMLTLASGEKRPLDK